MQGKVLFAASSVQSKADLAGEGAHTSLVQRKQINDIDINSIDGQLTSNMCVQCRELD